MSQMGGVQATKVIRQEVPEAKGILINQNDPSLGRMQAADVDARDFVAKIDLSRDLLSTIDRVVGQR